ncbi:two-component regulator propeller domain-containing protein [Saccharicrinis sp. FJH62]|uniref:hybrid sensor histidine kinase/response regulator transcription factor n=1 Tax=Saccharicrinis sp. FJH62 TaxID=3344657 RepID=UPI0035D42C66
MIPIYKLIFRYTVWLVFLFGVANVDAEKLTFKYVTNENGLSHNTVYDICQDDQGYMWFATEEGLNRYDGKNIKQYFSDKSEKSLPDNSVPCVANLSKNKLYIGTARGLARYNKESDVFIPVKYKEKAVGKIIAMVTGLPEELLICTEDNGAFIYNDSLNVYTKLDFLKERIFGMCVDQENTYWAFSRFTITRFNKNLQTLAAYHVSPNLINSAISYIKCDRSGNILLGTFENGLFIYNAKLNRFDKVEIGEPGAMYFIRSIEEGNSADEYWIGTEKGLFVINIKNKSIDNYSQFFDPSLKTIDDNAVYKVYKNRQNVYFIGTYFGGVNIANRQDIGFHAVLPRDSKGSLRGKALGKIIQVDDNELLIATEDAGLAIYNITRNSFTHLTSKKEDPGTLSTNNIHALSLDKGNICWVGHFNGGLSKLDISTGKVTRYIHHAEDPGSLSNNFVFALYPFSPDSLFVGTMNGIDILHKKENRFSRFRINELNDCFIYSIFNDPEGKIWILTYNNGIFILKPDNKGLMVHYQMGDGSGLPDNSVISYLVDSNNRIWIGTRGGGLCRFNEEKQSFISYSDSGLLNNDVIYGILEDNTNDFWISTNKGITKIDWRSNKSTHFNHQHGLAGNQFNYKSYFKDSRGRMYFGSISGLTWFDPDKIKIPDILPEVHFTDFKIFNDVITPETSEVLNKDIDFTQDIDLKYNQNSVTFDFTSINYEEADVSFQYYLENFDSRWSPLSHATQANYTNLSPGEYIFRIRSAYEISKQPGPERSVLLVIAPPIWATWYAYIFYLLLIASVVMYFYKNYTRRQKEKVALSIEKIEKQNLQLLHQHKMNFFTYISHEFKTPLSIIIASAEILMKRDNADLTEREETHLTIKRSATRLMTLINQLMDFRKIETDHTNLESQKGNLVDFFHQIINVYQPLIKKKSIDLKLQVNSKVNEVYFDFDKLEKIFTNLFTNAIKYTPASGDIEFNLNADKNEFEFSVKDSGSGMTKSQTDKIFEVFYSDQVANTIVESSGVGLALTAELVKFLKGEIHVDSEPDKGCKFTVKLPLSKSETETKVYKRKVNTDQLMDLIPIDGDNKIYTEFRDDKKYTVVIAEDNLDLLRFLTSTFKVYYNIKSFSNGLTAWEYVGEKVPDLLITDLMMPGMDGIELCERIRADERYCHIPVVMLTAKNKLEDKLEGLEAGADMYIEKPFSMKELETVIKNMFRSRELMKQKLTEMAKIEGLNMPKVNADQAFIEKLFGIIHENMENPDLDIQFIVEKLNISRTGMHNRIKTIMNMSTTEFINMVKINKAKELIRGTDLIFSEVAYKVGYNDVSYFSRIFKKLTGVTPGEYKKEGETTENKY